MDYRRPPLVCSSANAKGSPSGTTPTSTRFRLDRRSPASLREIRRRTPPPSWQQGTAARKGTFRRDLNTCEGADHQRHTRGTVGATGKTHARSTAGNERSHEGGTRDRVSLLAGAQPGMRLATFATPARAQTSSLSPPGAPPTPSAATMTLFALKATAPGSAMTFVTVASRGA